ALLQRAARSRDATTRTVQIPFEDFSLAGLLSVPPSAETIVVFVHGSGSSGLSSRNQRCPVSQSAGMATLLFDLLTPEEEEEDSRTAALRFNIDLLTRRLQHVIHWLQHQPGTAGMSVALFGASTGAAAALKAAAQLR